MSQISPSPNSWGFREPQNRMAALKNTCYYEDFPISKDEANKADKNISPEMKEVFASLESRYRPLLK